MKIETETKKSGEDKWWTLVLMGLFFVGFGIYMYQDLTCFEQQGGQRSLNWIFAIMFNAFGKWGVVGPIILGGAATLFAGIVRRIKMA